MDAFDADVLIYAIVPDHPLGRRIAALFRPSTADDEPALTGIGSVLLLPEVLSLPRREGVTSELRALGALLRRLELRSVDVVTADLAADLGARYRLRAADAVHLATAVQADADRFITNNQRDFPKTIAEVDVTYPDDLSVPA